MFKKCFQTVIKIASVKKGGDIPTFELTPPKIK